MTRSTKAGNNLQAYVNFTPVFTSLSLMFVSSLRVVGKNVLSCDFVCTLKTFMISFKLSLINLMGLDVLSAKVGRAYAVSVTLSD